MGPESSTTRPSRSSTRRRAHAATAGSSFGDGAQGPHGSSLRGTFRRRTAAYGHRQGAYGHRQGAHERPTRNACRRTDGRTGHPTGSRSPFFDARAVAPGPCRGRCLPRLGGRRAGRPRIEIRDGMVARKSRTCSVRPRTNPPVRATLWKLCGPRLPACGPAEGCRCSRSRAACRCRRPRGSFGSGQYKAVVRSGTRWQRAVRFRQAESGTVRRERTYRVTRQRCACPPPAVRGPWSFRSRRRGNRLGTASVRAYRHRRQVGLRGSTSKLPADGRGKRSRVDGRSMGSFVVANQIGPRALGR